MSCHSQLRELSFSGTYCKWVIRGEPGSSLVFSVSELVLPRHGAECEADGVVLYGSSGSSRTSTYGNS